MPGSVVDVSRPGVRIPDPIAVDTNLIVERLIVPFLGSLSQRSTVNAQRSAQFFHQLALSNGTGIVTPTAFVEFVHVAVQFTYRNEYVHLRATGQLPTSHQFSGWRDLYKHDATILQEFRADLEQLRQLLVTNGLLFIAPEDLGPISSGRSHDEELVHVTGMYGLDSNDAAILVEARRCGISDIISLDADMQRAQADFNIYTWI